MLRKRSRTLSSKQDLMADHDSLTHKYGRLTSSLFNSPRLFTAFSPKGFSDSESMVSPTSILDRKLFCSIGNPFWSDKSPKSIDSHIENKNPFAKVEPRGVGLGIVEALDENCDKKSLKPDTRMVLFGSQLKVPIPTISSSGSLKHHENFGVQTHNSQSCCISPTLSPSSDQKAPTGCHEVLNSPCVYTNQLSVSEMELSEDYTCVISHGPNPRTTHIFDNYIVESCSGFSNSKELFTNHSGYPFHGFLSFCHACKRNIEQGKDIYMYRGEKAFCSRECRNQEMLLDEAVDKFTSSTSLINF